MPIWFQAPCLWLEPHQDSSGQGEGVSLWQSQNWGGADLPPCPVEIVVFFLYQNIASRGLQKQTGAPGQLASAVSKTQWPAFTLLNVLGN